MMHSDNLEINEGKITVKVNPKLYPIEAVYSAAYVLIGKAYVVLDGDLETEILVKIVPKEGSSLEELGESFNDELINYADYLSRAKETKKIRELLLQRAIITNDSSVGSFGESTEDESEEFENLDNLDDDFLEDPEGIAVPWEEKYGSKKKEQDESSQNENKTE